MLNELYDPTFLKEVAVETSSEWYIDESKKPSAEEVPVASFRKLNVD